MKLASALNLSDLGVCRLRCSSYAQSADVIGHFGQGAAFIQWGVTRLEAFLPAFPPELPQDSLARREGSGGEDADRAIAVRSERVHLAVDARLVGPGVGARIGRGDQGPVRP